MYNNTIKNQSHHLITCQSFDSVYSDVVLIGAGIMSVTLGMFLIILEPTWKIVMYERLEQPAQESSNAWNNAGTGHAAFCELNYTPEKKDGSIDISKAIKINQEFELSRQFWAYLTRNNILKNPKSFINKIPHMNFVWGESNIYFLKKRFQILKNNPIFQNMIYSEDPKIIYQWAPLLINGRNPTQKIAATYIENGTDINFGELTKQMFFELKKHTNFKIYLQHNVTKIYQNNDSNNWKIHTTDLCKKRKKYIYAKYVFIGSGGKSLNLLQTAKIKESIGYAGFPVGGQFLITKNPKIIKQHSAKVYGKAPINTPPMSIPHIDTRILNEEKILLFGPFATFSSKFLKHGSWLDLFQSINIHNIIPILQAGKDNFQLIRYLINQLMMSHTDRIKILKKYYPMVNPSDWSLLSAGQRVQIIKKNNQGKGILQFGTEIISSENGTLSALLGASPGASTSVFIILTILKIMCKKHNILWTNKIKKIIPSYHHELNDNLSFDNHIKTQTDSILELNI